MSLSLLTKEKMKTCLVMYGHFPLVFHSFMMYVRRNDFEILSCIFLRLFPVCNFYRHFYIDIPVELFTCSCMRDFVFSVFITFFHSSFGGGGPGVYVCAQEFLLFSALLVYGV